MSAPIELTIDGVACTCERGEYLYDVARRHGIEIPTLCRSDAFEDHRACCRVCIVEVEENGWTKIVASCVYPVERPCIVRTDTDRIREERAVIMALLAKRAPDSPAIAELARSMGGADGFERLAALDAGSCILCGLCVQACDSLGTGAISTVLRGTEKAVDTPYGNPSLSCIGCLSCANVCPTDAIPWQQTATTRIIWNKGFQLARCARCGAVMGTKEAVAWAVRGSNAEPPTVCDACRKEAIADAMVPAYRNV